MVVKSILFGLTCWCMAMNPIHGFCQPRHQRFLKQIDSRDLTELIGSLSGHDKGYFDAVEASALQPSAVGDSVTKIRAVLNDQRVVRIFEKLQRMEKADADALVQRAYAGELQGFKRRWMQADGAIRPASERHAVHALLFLSANFCSDDVFEKNCSDWSYWFYVNQDKGKYFRMFAAPDTLLLVNLYAIKLMQQDRSLAEANKNVEELCQQLNCGQLPQLGMHGLVQMEIGEGDAVTCSTITGFPVFYNWGGAINLTGTDHSDLILRARVVSAARSWTRPPNFVTDWLAASTDRTFEAFELWLREKNR